MAIEVGNVLEGRVTGVKPFGAFVALPEGKSGMVHISEVSNEYVQDINTVLHDGDAVKVQVINIAPDGKIALSIKRLLPPAPRQPREGRGPAGPRPGGFRNGQEGGRSGGARGAGRAPREGGRGPAREAAPRVWQPKAPARSDNLSFEDMMSRFKSQSEEKNGGPRSRDQQPPWRRLCAPQPPWPLSHRISWDHKDTASVSRDSLFFVQNRRTTMPAKFELIAPCFFGCESTAKFELTRIGAENIRVEDGRLSFCVGLR